MSLRGIFSIEKLDFLSSNIPANIGDGEWKKLMAKSTQKQYKKGTTIFKEGDTPRGIYYVHSGIIKKYKIDNTGRQHIFYIANKGELFGYHAVLAEESYTESTAALHDCVVNFITTSDFFSVLNNSQKLNRQLLKTLSHEFTVFTNSLTVVAQKSVKERIVISLIILREKFKQVTKKNHPVYITVLRDDIASMASTTRENVTRVLAELKKENIVVTIGRRIEVIDIKALADLANFSE